MDFVLSNTHIVITLFTIIILNIIMSIFILKKYSNFLERVVALLTVWLIPLLGILIILVASHFKKLKE